MREIKFRAWSVEEKKMIDVMEWMPEMELLKDIFNEEGTIFMQFTGLRDKNGKEIYEGDVVEHKSKYEHVVGKFEVRYTEGNFAAFCLFNLDKSKWREKTDDSEKDGWEGVVGSQGHLNTKLEVIGNIYENPELLK